MSAIDPDDKFFLIRFIGAVALAMAFFAAITIFISGCSPKASNEISEMALECFKNKQGITITFIPQQESKEVQKTDK